MPSTYTLNNGIELIATGEQSGTWGDTTNTNLELLDTALDGQVTVTLTSAGTSGSPNTLAISDGAASNGRNRMVIFDDSSDLGATAYVQLTPNDAEKIIYVRNSLSGSRSILLFQGTYNASNDYEVPAGTTAVIFFDGAGSGAVAANVLSDLQVENLSVFGTAPTITLTDTDTGVDTELNAASSVGQFTLNIDKNNEGSSPRLVTQISGTEFFRINESGAVFNESSEDQDFRVESNSNTHMLFVDGGNNKVGINESSPDTLLHLSGANNASDANNALRFTDTDTAVVADQKIGRIEFETSDTSNPGVNLQIDGIYGGSGAGSELVIRTGVAGSLENRMFIQDVETVFNEDGGDNDFRVESDSNTHALFVDAGSSEVGINNDTPDAALHVKTTATNVALFDSSHATSTQAFIRNSNAVTGTYALLGFSPANDVSGAYIQVEAQEDFSTSANRTADMQFYTRKDGNWYQRLYMDHSAAIFNEDSTNTDFRVESDGNANMLFVDAGNNRTFFGSVGFTTGLVGMDYDLDNSSDWYSDSQAVLMLKNSNANGQVALKMNNQGTNSSFIVHNTSGNEGFHIYDRTITGKRFSADSSETVINEDSKNLDFRVESDGNTHMLAVDGAENCVSVGTSDTSVSALNVFSNGTGTAAISARGNGAANGMVLLGDRYTDDENQITLGVGYANATAVLARGCKPAPTGTNGFVSSQDTYNNRPAALTVQDGGLRFFTTTSSSTTTTNSAVTLYNYFEIDQGETTFNEDSINQDFRVESDASAYGFFVDAGTGYLAARGGEQVRFTLGSEGTTGANTANWIRGSGNSIGLNAASGNIHFEVGGNEKMRIESTNQVLVGTSSTNLGGSAVTGMGVQTTHTSGAQSMTVYCNTTSCAANGIFLVGTARTNNSAYDIMNGWSNAVNDKEFRVRGDGNVFCDGSFTGGGADYAEYFEWSDGNADNEDRRGYSVVLDNEKIRKATSSDAASSIIGVISGNPSVVGDGDIHSWKNKYLRDDFGGYARDENGDRVLNPDYDPDQEYTSREDRIEWDTVGLMGKLRIRKGQPTGSNWIKMRDVSDTVEEWLVR